MNSVLARPALRLDHLAVVARTLDEGCAHVTEQIGVEMGAGGTHPTMGTHNRLLSLGADRYLEVIAVDPVADPPDRPRWFGLDRFDGEPQLATWIVATDDIDTVLDDAHPASGRATPLSRGNLRWTISIADDGALPLDGAFPSLIEWPPGPHPAGLMKDAGCRLSSLVVEHPRAEEIESFVYGRLDETVEIEAGPAARLTATFETPAGTRTLS